VKCNALGVTATAGRASLRSRSIRRFEGGQGANHMAKEPKAKKRKVSGVPTSTEKKLAAGTDWKYVPIRRLVLFLEHSLYKATNWLVSEPKETKKRKRKQT